jgi:eukaryotic-like serine/threonine-protein kinase
MVELAVREGDRIGGYLLLRQIGEGGMGVVWMAAHGVLGRRAAIKFLRPECSLQRDIVTRFFNEARAATAISDPGIIQIFDVGHHDGSAYIVMELLEGESLDGRLKRDGVLPIRSALRLCRQAASAVGAAHERGIVHRDLKPENIFVVRDPEVAGGERAKVLDFGIAKLAGNLGTHFKTSGSVVIGTPPYMSPEQCRGAGEVDQRSDIYSLGCVLFTLLVGRPPFDTRAPGVLLMQHMTDVPPTPSHRAPGIPVEVDALILRCLAKDPAQRFASGTELALAIDALAVMSAAATTAPGGIATAPGGATPERIATTLGAAVTYSTPAPSATVRRRRQKLYAGIGAATLAVAGAIATVVVSRGQPASSEVATRPPAPVALVTEPPTPEPVREPQPIPAPRPRAIADLRALLVAFSAWARGHAGSPCPTASELVGGGVDPWGHAYEVTCTEQPVDQIVGARSNGPDGVKGTADDLMSWTFDDAVTLARGPRWGDGSRPMVEPEPAAQETRGKSSSRKLRGAARVPPDAAEPEGIVDIDGDGIPDTRR